MRVFKIKQFHQWTKSENLSDAALMQASNEVEQGLVDANLGGNVYKKRVALSGRGKRSGARTIIVFRHGESAFFVYGFTKSKRANISDKELKALKLLAAKLLNMKPTELKKALQAREIIEVTENE